MGIRRSLILLCLAMFGCGSQPLPMDAVEGTTAIITVPDGLGIGYGRAWAGHPDFDLVNPALAPAPGAAGGRAEDFQRGEMIFLLTDTQSGFVKRLPVRLITSVAIDPASTEALDPSNVVVERQTVVLLDIPTGIVSDAERSRNMTIFVHRYRRDPTTQTFAQIPFTSTDYLPSSWGAPKTLNAVGWANNPSPPAGNYNFVSYYISDPNNPGGPYPIPITIVDSPKPEGSEVNPNEPRTTSVTEGWLLEAAPPSCSPYTVRMRRSDGLGFNALLEDTVPNPEFEIAPSVGGTSAWEVNLTFPKERMRVLGAHLDRENAIGGFLAWTADSSVTPSGSSCGNAPGNLKLRVADPAGLTEKVRVVFELTNTTLGSSCRVPIVSSDLVINSTTSKAYNNNGAVVPASFVGALPN